LALFTPLFAIQETRSESPCEKSALSTLAWICNVGVAEAATDPPTAEFELSSDNPAAASPFVDPRVAASAAACTGLSGLAATDSAAALCALVKPAA